MSNEDNSFELKKEISGLSFAEDEVHTYGNNVVCSTDVIGHSEIGGKGIEELVLDRTAGFIPLWKKHTVLYWKFDERSFSAFKSPSKAKNAVKSILTKAINEWGFTPVRFKENNDIADFEISFNKHSDCSDSGCVLASAFFPDGGRNKLILYPEMFEQNERGRVNTMIHELGHIFGLRHFFAKVSEQAWESEVFGEHNKFSIMNYGNESTLTDADKNDLEKLYTSVWDKKITHINNTPISLISPFNHYAYSLASESLA